MAGYESGARVPLDSVILSICREFNVDEHWLRTGEGEPYLKFQKNKIITQSAALLGYKDPLFESLIDTYSQLSDDDKAVLIRTAEGLLKTYPKKE